MKQLALAFAAICALVTGCVAPSSGGSYSSGHAAPAYSAPAYTAGTGVYVNGQEISADDKAQLDAIFGESVPAGRYAMDAQYNFGYEGQAPVVNLAELARTRQQQGYANGGGSDDGVSMYSTDSAGRGSSMVGYGDCVSMSTPDGTFMGSGC
jgi:hypothetical protein